VKLMHAQSIIRRRLPSNLRFESDASRRIMRDVESVGKVPSGSATELDAI
jgi:hypothetical protein